jgi:hypothetical protein
MSKKVSRAEAASGGCLGRSFVVSSDPFLPFSGSFDDGGGYTGRNV